MLVVCFFKQKTAYEMRISDWSSDVCSSDLQSVLSRVRTVVNRRAGSIDKVEGPGAVAPVDVLLIAEQGMTPLVLRPPEQTDQVAIGPKDTVDMEAVRTRGDNRGDSRNAEVHVHERGLEDRKRVVSGKRVSTRVILGGLRIDKINQRNEVKRY